MGVVDDPSETGLLLLRLGRTGQTAFTANHHRLVRRDSSAKSKPSVLSSSGPSLTLGFSNGAVKKESDGDGSDEEEDGGGGGDGSRKKLRLTKEQSALLEDRFNEHSTLNPKQKLALAKQLSLRPRQVEVWFQNRRARTKLKQTEVDCEFLRRCCESLTEENRRLHGELQELRSLKLAAATQLSMQVPPATLMLCPSCERVAVVGEADDVVMERAFSPAMKAMMKKKSTLLLKYS
ncbi:homeobox-leucine zipper protein HOX17-like [Dendrobium catenatum]|uniref:Homeobox-leucine zipper protein HOX19 n=1 Tax=Dendrobium catenatum TaxID=906689 RepID=A0A2I0WKN9_9ASPA|nr:homeobox-leucine zipper protein HOX17-like [Dendrobium catenatum]PKU76230.1 Homeobox-leucine zipper protein HOX19 [Dendrobium catenatum]